MIVVAVRTIVRFHSSNPLHSGTTAAVLATNQHHNTFATRNKSTDRSNAFRRVQVQIVHRHGDRSPITPLKDEAYWQSQLIKDTTLQKIAENTRLIEADEPNTHTAGGRGPFGKLSDLGLLQMVQVGTNLREQLVGENRETHIFTPDRPLQPSNIRIFSTNFPRTIQSVQGLLVGFFPDGIPDPGIEINVRMTNTMIPDPMPRNTREQVQLEEKLARRPHMLQKEKDMLPLAIKTTKALHDLLAADAHEANFGVQASFEGSESIEVEPLSWNQLAEITKCLLVRDLLPPGITPNDVEVILEHAAWRWFQTFQNQRMAHLAMFGLTNRMLDYFTNNDQTPMTVWSAHDSTLIGLLCAFRLQRPSSWPEYASCLMLELLEREGSGSSSEQFVRFSLNGEILKSNITDEWLDLVPLKVLADKIRSQEKVTAGF